ncbi:MAG: hypothetical protein ACNA7O_15345 [Rhodobacterales bacterium]
MAKPPEKPADKSSTDKPDTATRLRADLDAGRGRDKVAYPDPAAAPMETDAEAAGTPITPEQARMARAAEIRDVDHPETDTARTAGGRGAISVPGADRAKASDIDPAATRPAKQSAGLITLAIVLTVALVILLFIS